MRIDLFVLRNGWCKHFVRLVEHGTRSVALGTAGFLSLGAMGAASQCCVVDGSQHERPRPEPAPTYRHGGSHLNVRSQRFPKAESSPLRHPPPYLVPAEAVVNVNWSLDLESGKFFLVRWRVPA